MSERPLLLGIDIGGTGTKAGVFTLDGDLVGSGYGEYQMISTVPGQAEHDAELWWQATIKAVKDSLQDADPDDIKAIGVGCTNGLIAVDEKGTEAAAATAPATGAGATVAAATKTAGA